jgi:hypothetical protein
MNPLIKNKNDIDWSIFSPGDEGQVSCRCGGSYSSHVKGIWVAEDQYKMHSQRPCPNCGQDDDIYRVTTEPESFTITPDDVGSMDVDDLLK